MESEAVGKKDRKREGKFAASLRGRMEVIQALRDWGWSWRQIAAHFTDDIGLGHATEQHFSTEWNLLARRGTVADREEVARLKKALLNNAYEPDAWVRRAAVAAPPPLVERPVEVKPTPVAVAAVSGPSWVCGSAVGRARFPVSLAGRFFWFAGVSSSGRPLVHARQGLAA